MDSAKKQREKFLVEQFLEHQGQSYTDIRQLDPPDPDILVNLEGRKVGIELTELFVRGQKSAIHSEPVNRPLLQAVESITSSIVSKARKIYLEGEGPPVQAQIVFSNRITLEKKQADQIANLVAGTIHKMGIKNSQVIWRSNEDEREETLLSESVVSIHAHGVPNLHPARWFVANTAGWVSTLTPKHLQDRIDEKAKRINTYKNNTEEIWLLIIADRTRPSQNFSCPSGFAWGSLSSPFARTFYYAYPDGVIELKKV